MYIVNEIDKPRRHDTEFIFKSRFTTYLVQNEQLTTYVHIIVRSICNNKCSYNVTFGIDLAINNFAELIRVLCVGSFTWNVLFEGAHCAIHTYTYTKKIYIHVIVLKSRRPRALIRSRGDFSGYKDVILSRLFSISVILDWKWLYKIDYFLDIWNLSKSYIFHITSQNCRRETALFRFILIFYLQILRWSLPFDSTFWYYGPPFTPPPFWLAVHVC